MKWFNESLTELSAEELLAWAGGYGTSPGRYGVPTTPYSGVSGRPYQPVSAATYRFSSGSTGRKTGKQKYVPVSKDLPEKAMYKTLTQSAPLTKEVATTKTEGKTKNPPREDGGNYPNDPDNPTQPSSGSDNPSPVKEPSPKPPKVFPSPRPQPPMEQDPTELGFTLDTWVRTGENEGFCFAASLINQYALNGVNLNTEKIRNILKEALTTETWNGQNVVSRSGYVNHPDQLLAITAKHLGHPTLTTGDTKYSADILAVTYNLNTGREIRNLSVQHGQELLNAFKAEHFSGKEHQVQGFVVELTKNGQTHFVSVNQWDWSSLTDPHGGQSRVDWNIASLRVIT